MGLKGESDGHLKASDLNKEASSQPINSVVVMQVPLNDSISNEKSE